MSVLSFNEYDIICFSHLRWDFVFQRPQHLLSRFARKHKVLFVEEPIFHDGEAEFVIKQRRSGVIVVTPHLANGTAAGAAEPNLKKSLEEVLHSQSVSHFVSWYYTPMMLGWSEHLKPLAVVYDCMDELSAFKNAPPGMRLREAELLGMADIVFTGGQSLYEAKRDLHEAVYCFPSSIDVDHFSRALMENQEPDDQAGIPHPRIGFFGVIDERTDLDLLSQIANLRPDWHFVMIGPVVKIDENDLPRSANIHYLGGKSYDDLPAYIAAWDVAMMPFAMNDSTRFISPTKTPEYLAAGRAVVATPVRDVVRLYGETGLVHIADTPEDFVRAINSILNGDIEEHRRKAGEFLETMSWEKTYVSMSELIDEAVASNSREEAFGAKDFILTNELRLT
ncbi:MAG TPA: glycosyltransferase family 1 protein [Pyrinomonadaceae bacterium]|nr:glycosyltransferase family 1 protein [Pyrinomonadaceae bacterium]